MSLTLVNAVADPELLKLFLLIIIIYYYYFFIIIIIIIIIFFFFFWGGTNITVGEVSYVYRKNLVGGGGSGPP